MTVAGADSALHILFAGKLIAKLCYEYKFIHLLEKGAPSFFKFIYGVTFTCIRQLSVFENMTGIIPC
jgi:hypothetical protein